jgi:hypothetical protein
LKPSSPHLKAAAARRLARNAPQAAGERMSRVLCRNMAIFSLIFSGTVSIFCRHSELLRPPSAREQESKRLAGVPSIAKALISPYNRREGIEKGLS